MARAAGGLVAAGVVGGQVAGCAARVGGVEARPPWATGFAPTSADRADVLVVAPHPDDESLMAAGVIARAVRGGERAAVVFATNGDFGCERDGRRRDAEAVRALAALGVPAGAAYFLGYPDGHLADLGAVPLAPVPRRDAAGGCGAGAATYATYGAGGADVHTLLTGAPGLFTAANLAGDLAALLDRARPRDIYIAHPADHHPDHAATYAYLRRALERTPTWRPGEAGVRVHRALVHVGGCWPMAAEAPAAGDCAEVRFEPGAAWPPLPAPLGRYRPNEERPAPDDFRSNDPARNPKFLAIAAHASQTGPRPPLSYLFSFARGTEPFWVETLVADAGRTLRRAPAPGARGRVEAAAAFASGAGTAAGRFVRRGELRAPLWCDVTAGALDPEVELAVLGRDGSGYVLRARADAVALWRGARELRRWTLPADSGPAEHAYALALDVRPDDGGAAELTVRRDGEVLGVAVDPDPVTGGDEIAVNVTPARSRPACRPW